MSIHNIPFSNIKKKITLNFPNLQPRDYCLGTQDRVRNSRGKRAISVLAIEVLLYFLHAVIYYVCNTCVCLGNRKMHCLLKYTA